ncbi:MAG TPA: glycosyltransferase family 9 protein [Blastocatellia bacterium]|nr:glycosyltransferase family 9 protein [Blastocatellia bacterium]
MSLFQNLPENSRVLFIRLRNLGEAVLDTANLRMLKGFRPDLRITTLVEAIYTDLYAADPDLEALSLPRAARDQRSSLAARLNIIKEIRGRRFTAVINLHGGPTSAQLTLISGARHRIGARHFRHSYAYNLRIPQAEEILGRADLHTVEYQFGQFRWLGLPGTEPGPTQLFPDPQRRETARAKLRAAGIDPEQPYAVLGPTNEFYTKRWMPERYAAVAEQLQERGLQTVMTGAPTEEQQAQLAAVQTATRRPVAALSSLNIGELVSVVAESRLFVGNDSGPAHIAAALKVPLVVLFGPASSTRWRPWRAPSQLVQNHFACNPCSMYTCEAFDQPECIRSIGIQQVLDAIEQVLRADPVGQVLTGPSEPQ